ncbi:hypothetical protein [Kitasatospora mediocidica]|uniref:hypothetical protein n=1 Tax=Kitasatospora mediocidica TaxID=58352 RepID=UPI000B0ED334|nr:hypothetical protein [Kitasatospora mediocidica]
MGRPARPDPGDPSEPVAAAPSVAARYGAPMPFDQTHGEPLPLLKTREMAHGPFEQCRP